MIQMVIGSTIWAVILVGVVCVFWPMIELRKDSMPKPALILAYIALASIVVLIFIIAIKTCMDFM